MTSKSLTKLFNPITKDYEFMSGYPIKELHDMLQENNFIDVKVTKLEYHRFILVKLNNIWYLMNSFAEKYTLKIKQVDPYDLLTNMNADTYNTLFEDKIYKSGYAKLIIKIGLYYPDYNERMISFLSKHIYI